MAFQASWCGDPDAGLTCTESALVRAARLTATERTMLHNSRARARSSSYEYRSATRSGSVLSSLNIRSACNLK